MSSLVDIFIHHTSRFLPILYLKRTGLVGISIAPSKGMSSSFSARSLAPLLAITLICLGWSPVILVFSYFLTYDFSKLPSRARSRGRIGSDWRCFYTYGGRYCHQSRCSGVLNEILTQGRTIFEDSPLNIFAVGAEDENL